MSPSLAGKPSARLSACHRSFYTSLLVFCFKLHYRASPVFRPALRGHHPFIRRECGVVTRDLLPVAEVDRDRVVLRRALKLDLLRVGLPFYRIFPAVGLCRPAIRIRLAGTLSRQGELQFAGRTLSLGLEHHVLRS